MKQARLFLCCLPRTVSQRVRCSRPTCLQERIPVRGCGRAKAPTHMRRKPSRTAELVAERVPGIPKWWFAFQSQGASGGPWIGPSVEETLTAIAEEGVKTLLLQPIGFLCDHVEILYDVDIAFKEYASELGVRLERPESLNASPTLARAVAGLAKCGLGRLQG